MPGSVESSPRPGELRRGGMARARTGVAHPLTWVLGAAGVVFALLVARALGAEWFPVHDLAFTELRTRDVGSAHTPLVGPYSRYGWSHPGPLIYYLLAGPYRVSGGSPSGLLVGTVLVHAATAAAALWLAWRRGGRWLLAATAVLWGLFLAAQGGEALLAPWNPFVTGTGSALLLLAAWSAARGDRVGLAAWVVTGSFLVQSHAGFGLLVLASAVPVGWGVWRHRPSRRVVVAVVAVGTVLWLPPVVDQLAGEGNLAELARFFAPGAGAADPPVGWGRGVRTIASQLRLAGPWSTGDEPLTPFTAEVAPSPATALAVPLGALAAAAIVAGRRRDTDALALVGVAALADVAAVVSVAGIRGEVLAYLTRPFWGVALVHWLAVARSVAPALAAGLVAAGAAPSAAARARTATAAVVAGAVAVLVVPWGTARDATPIESDRSAVVGLLWPSVDRALGDPEHAVLVVPVDPEATFPHPGTRQLASALVARLAATGRTPLVRAEDWMLPPAAEAALLVGDHRVHGGQAVAGTAWVVEGRTLDTWQPPPSARRIARAGDPADARELARLEAELEEAFRADGHPEEAARVRGPDLGWIPFTQPALAEHLPVIERLLALREEPRVEVWWEPASAGGSAGTA